jgi:hypothetical protein
VQPGLVFTDEDGAEVVLDAEEAKTLLALTSGLEAATVSACPDCPSRVLAAVALVDLLEMSPPHPRSSELIELADEAPTLHVYVLDVVAECRHREWRDPGYLEWRDAVADLIDEPNRPR